MSPTMSGGQSSLYGHWGCGPDGEGGQEELWARTELSSM